VICRHPIARHAELVSASIQRCILPMSLLKVEVQSQQTLKQVQGDAQLDINMPRF